MAFIEIRNISKSYDGVPVLKHLSMSVEAHEVVSLIGPSGSGKSTLLRCINGLEAIDDGEIRINGDRITGPGVDVNALRRDIGIVFQGYNLFPHMTVLENVTLAPIQVLKLAKRAAEDRAMALLTRFGLADKAREYPDRLSGGQQQRTAIVRACAPLGFDEATRLEPIQCLIERAVDQLERAASRSLEPIRDLVAVHRAPGQRL